jgi:cyclopropane-fatty-acyl-phospholipid synthase
MPAFPLRRPSPAAAERVVRRVFGHLRGPIAMRLWDGRTVHIGDGPPVCTVVITSPDVFLRLIQRPTPYTFAEAYIEGAIDLDGDLFAAMHVANELEELRLPLRTRLGVVADLWKGRS